MLNLRRDERNVWLVVGTCQRWQTGSIGIPRCFPCKRTHWIYQLHKWTLFGAGCLVIPLTIITLAAAILAHDYFGFRVIVPIVILPIVAVTTLIRIPTRLYVRRHPRNEPEEYPPLAELKRQGWTIGS
ncbi:hypothetical protein [Streptomyces sp. 6N223]|uniref:hypothetical protein n=1 Tax=Streptomyces sp. 6N223 TaxID=3457412 RepID=UPI003FCF5D1B